MIGLGGDPCFGTGPNGEIGWCSATMPGNNAICTECSPIYNSYSRPWSPEIPDQLLPPPPPPAPAPMSMSTPIPMSIVQPAVVVGSSGAPITPAPISVGTSYPVQPLPPVPQIFPMPLPPAPPTPAVPAPPPSVPIVPPSTSGQSVANSPGTSSTAGASSSSSSTFVMPDTIFGINSTYVLIGGAVLLFLMMGKK